jgi:archaellum component FlaG (FlaF/FlaG flagellin family)
MALIDLPEDTPTEVSAGTASGLIIANAGQDTVTLNTTDPTVDGPAVTLDSNESVIMEPGSVWAASTWYGYATFGGRVAVTEVA